tara:strand:- start:2 stop:1138 length:1137 start_codon:yes stop_codon:yes gene_type:complete
MNFEICKEFKENFYEVHSFNGLRETKDISLKSSWVFKTIGKNNKRWSPKCLQRFFDTLPICYQICSTELYERYIEVAKTNFIEALYFYTQENANVECLTGRDTSNTSSNIGSELYKLRLRDIHDYSCLSETYDLDNLHAKKYKKTEQLLKEEESFSWSKSLTARNELIRYFTADKDFAFKMMLLLGTLNVKESSDDYDYSYYQIHDVSSEYGDINPEVAYKTGEALFFEKFLDGVEEKYANEALSNIRKTKKALDLLKVDPYRYIFNEKNRTKFGTYDRYSDLYTSTESVWDQQKKITMVLPEHKVAVSSMIGASKLISKYQKFFDTKDIESLKKRKSFYGRKIQLTCKKEFMLSDDDSKKYYHHLDKNDRSIFPHKY